MKTTARTLLSGSISRLLRVLVLFHMLALLLPQMAELLKGPGSIFTGTTVKNVVIPV